MDAQLIQIGGDGRVGPDIRVDYVSRNRVITFVDTYVASQGRAIGREESTGGAL